MKERVLMKGNEAIAEAAVRGGCRFFAGYPITPQNEIPEYLSKRLPEVGGSFIQSESEVSAINMIYGASCAGARAMTSSSSPGISLKQEGLSYIACGQLPCVVINMVRGGPGLGTIYPGQADYFQAVKGGGHGDYKLFVYTPATVQEAVDITYKSFEMADKYRIPVLILGDGTIGQMMEPVVLPEMKDPATFPEKKWALTGCKGRERNIINTLDMNPERLEAITDRLFDVYEQIRENVDFPASQVTALHVKFEVVKFFKLVLFFVKRFDNSVVSVVDKKHDMRQFDRSMFTNTNPWRNPFHNGAFGSSDVSLVFADKAVIFKVNGNYETKSFRSDRRAAFKQNEAVSYTFKNAVVKIFVHRFVDGLDNRFVVFRQINFRENNVESRRTSVCCFFNPFPVIRFGSVLIASDNRPFRHINRCVRQENFRYLNRNFCHNSFSLKL